jgi:MFS transporter, DHA2 family, methylenomycin A resistance protein
MNGADMGNRNQRRITLIATCLSYVVVILDTSVVNVALERMGDGLNASMSGLQWVVNAYMLILASLLLTGSTLCDRWGPRPVYLLGMAVFAAASLLCGVAPSLAALVSYGARSKGLARRWWCRIRW